MNSKEIRFNLKIMKENIYIYNLTIYLKKKNMENVINKLIRFMLVKIM